LFLEPLQSDTVGFALKVCLDDSFNSFFSILLDVEVLLCIATFGGFLCTLGYEILLLVTFDSSVYVGCLCWGLAVQA